MLEKIQKFDTNLFVFLNGLGSESYDKFWIAITNQINWIPFFLLLLYLVYKKMGTKQTLFILLFIAILIACTDQLTNLVKYSVQRQRPCNNPDIQSFIRIVQSSPSFSFFSGHAANSMATATFLYLLLKKHYKYFGLLFLWPLIFAYSRIYIGKHYPLDIFCGFLAGAIMGFLMYKIYQKVRAMLFNRLTV